VHWGQHPLRPEFLESTYFLHRATGDDHYLWVARAALKALQKHTRVPCGYAAVNDVRTRIHEDRMDSYVLAETFKYLYMIFSDDADLPVNLEDYIMTTEAHFLPLSLAGNSNNSSDFSGFDEGEIFYYSRWVTQYFAMYLSKYKCEITISMFCIIIVGRAQIRRICYPKR